MATLEEQKALGREVADYFTRNPAIKFLGFAGVGRHGGALILQENDEQGQMRRKLVVKYSLGVLTSDRHSDADEDLRNEYYWLKLLRGAEHIVRLVPFADCSLHLPGMSDGQATYSEAVAHAHERDEALRRELEGVPIPHSRARKCPTFALEYLPNGQLIDTIEKHVEDGVEMPNRVLWRIWLCMVRQCVAMAFPPNIAMGEEDDGASIRERIIDTQQFCTLTQNSAHLENWLWGPERDGSPDEDHDPAMPAVKLIDFGRGKLENLISWLKENLDDIQQCGSMVNLYSASHVMTQMALPLVEYDDILPVPPTPYKYSKGGQEFEVITQAPPRLRIDGRLDRPLRDTLVRCMADRAGNAPSLREVLAEAEEYVAKKFGEDGVMENDYSIRQWTQKYIYNAD